MHTKKKIFLAILMLLSSCAVAYSQNDELLQLKKGQPIIVDGDKVEYFDRENKIVAEGNVSITYGDVKLSCDYIEVNTKAQTAICRGNVHIKHPDGELTGDYIAYDLLNKKGGIISPEVKAFPWFGRAEETTRVGANEYLLKGGFVSTCDLDEPHYRIAAKEIRVIPDKEIIAKNAFIYIGQVPVLWFPYYYQPIIESRAKVQFIPGQSSEWGYFLLSAWRFYIRGNTRVDALIDYRAKKGLAEGANLYYYADDVGLTGWGEGLFRSYFIHQNGKAAYDPTAYRDEGAEPDLRKRFQWNHRVDLAPGTVGMMEFNKLSDENIIKDYFFNEYEENNVVPPNYFSLISAQDNYTFNINLKKRFNDFYTVVEKFPELRVDVPAQRLGDTSLYYDSIMSATAFTKKYSFESQPSEKVERFDYIGRLSYVSKAGFLNVTPFGTFRETAYDKDRRKMVPVSREVLGGGVAVFSRFHRVYDAEMDTLGLDINGLRHIVVPSAEYSHVHRPNVDKGDLFQMDEIDSIEKENKVALSLENKLQTKRHSDGDLKSVDLARFIVGTDYFFRTKKDVFKIKDEGKFGNILFDLELSPYKWLYVDSELAVAPKNRSVRTGSLEVSLRPWENLNTAVGYRYEKKTADTRNQLTFDINFTLNPKWKFGWYERLDLTNNSVEEQQFSVTRDLHCWEVEVTYDIEGNNFLKDDYTFWIAFKIKAFPDLPIGLNRSFTRRPAGARQR